MADPQPIQIGEILALRATFIRARDIAGLSSGDRRRAEVLVSLLDDAIDRREKEAVANANT